MTGLAVADALHARLFCDHLVVVDRPRREMRVLNPIAALLWLLLDEAAHDVRSLEQAFKGFVKDAPADVASTIQTTLDEWRSLGWLEGFNGRYRIIRGLAAPPDDMNAGLHPAAIPLPDHVILADLNLYLGGKVFRVILGDSGAPGLPNILARLQALLSGINAGTDIDAHNAIQLRWVQDGKVFWLATDAGVTWTADEGLAISNVFGVLLQHAYDGLFATLHAAALSHAGEVVVLAGASGAGKSTLAAYLAAQGWGYLGDDVIALERKAPGERFKVCPFPTAISLKPGSWPSLRLYYPKIDNLPIIAYADRHARFLPLDNRADADGSAQCLRAIVLPRYTPGATVSIEAIEPVEALCGLIQAGITTGGVPEVQRVETILEMLEETPVYRLRYSDLAQAAEVLMKLVTCR